jgi:hypothetical protein
MRSSAVNLFAIPEAVDLDSPGGYKAGAPVGGIALRCR